MLLFGQGDPDHFTVKVLRQVYTHSSPSGTDIQHHHSRLYVELSRQADGEAMMAKTPAYDENAEMQKMPEEARAAIADVMQELGRIMDRISVDINFTERGIEIPTKVTLAQ